MLHPYIQQLCHDLSIEVPTPSAKDFYSFGFDKDLRVSIKALEGDGFYFSSKIAPCPQKHEEDFYPLLMLANLFGEGTGGAVIGMEEEGGWLTFSATLAHEMNYAQFREELEDFINYLELWQSKIPELATGLQKS